MNLTPRRPWIEALLAGLFGLALFALDDIWPHAHRSEPLLHEWTEWLELAVMTLGLAGAAWFAFSYRQLREQVLAEALAQEAAERFVVLGRLAGSMAHEIRNPLHNARLLVEAIMDGEISTESRDGLHRRLDDNLQRIDRAVDLVYLLARRSGEHQREPLDLVEAIRRAVAEIQLPSGLTFSLDLPAEAEVTTAPDLVRIIIGNLLRNAGQAASTARTAPQARLHIVDQRWHLRISNAGTAPPWLLDPAAPVPPGTGGLGLGLAISRQLSEQLGLQLRLDQEADQVVATLAFTES